MEVAAVLGQAFLAASFEGLLDQLTSGEFMKFAQRKGIKMELKKWEKLLRNVRAVLEDAEEKQLTDRSVKIWLSELQDVAYDLEDILDEFATEYLGRKLKAETQPGTCKVWKLIPTCCRGLNPATIKLNVKMRSKIKEITTRLQEITAQRDGLDLKELAGERYNRVRIALPTTSLVNEEHVYGRERDKEVILQLLLAGETSDSQVPVIPIVGMGGIGKTTLAQLVYNDDRVKQVFDVKAWVCVSDDFDVVRITKTILQALTSETHDTNDLNLLQVKLKEVLSKKKFLIVLDDIWSESYHDWILLRRPFEIGPPGSVIIITTRNQGVSATLGTIPAYPLQELLFDECLAIFSQHALGTKNLDGYPCLKQIGEKIVKRCKGLPLAATVLGGLLRNDLNLNKWEDILNSKIWDIAEEKNNILPALKVSYHHLPSHLKSCFVYCSLFPKDYEFDKEELIKLWMAEGFLQQPKGDKQMEDLGHEYFSDLLSRSFFQPSSRSNSFFVMHDLIHDLAASISGDLCTMLEENFEIDGQKNFEKVCHLSLIRSTYETSQRFEVVKRMKRLRSLVSLPISRSFVSSPIIWRSYDYLSGEVSHVSSPILRRSFHYLSGKVSHELLPKLRQLRVLSWSHYSISELPNSIGDLKHLRYLNFSGCEFKSLPESVTGLCNLQTLILRNCPNLTRLPLGIGNLINLHHLDIANTPQLREMPSGIGSLTSLQTLPKFIVGGADKLGIKELKNLLHLRKELSIQGLHHMVDFRDARIANLHEKQHLDRITLEWVDDFHDSRNERDEMQVLELLQPHRSLKRLSIRFYGGRVFPSWIGDPVFVNIVQLEIHGCRKSISLPSLGELPLLKNLRITGMVAVKAVGSEFFCRGGCSFVKPFPSLETLEFEDMLEWEEWSSCTSVEEVVREFPSLRELTIRNCPKFLGKLPRHLPSLTTLVIYRCPLLTDSLSNLPSLCDLNVEECNEAVLRSVVGLTSLTTLKIKKISGLTYLNEELIQNLTGLEILEIQGCDELTSLLQGGGHFEKLACLKSLVIRGCSQLISLTVEEQESLPRNLEELQLVSCRNFEKLSNGLHNLSSLKKLIISRCPKLVFFPATVLPSNLKYLDLECCEDSVFLFAGMTMMLRGNNSNLLEDLTIKHCFSLKSFPKGLKLSTLKRLSIINCANLLCLGQFLGRNTSHLQELTICGCSSLSSFPTGKIPASLQTLNIINCMQLESLFERMPRSNVALQFIRIENCANLKSLALESLHSLTHLCRLEIASCPALESFDNRALSIPILKTLTIEYCENLQSLPSQLYNLTSLVRLFIRNCPGIVNLPEGGLPPNLWSLDILHCKNLNQPMSEWGLHRLTSLQHFCIEDIGALDKVSFPNDDYCMLPTTLTFLEIRKLKNLEFLSRGFQELVSLQELRILDCPKLRSLPKEGLPASLGSLWISQCPLLKERCLKERGEYWSIISYIPRVEIDYMNIYEQSSN